ncbi:MAG TPA: hypothetical protein VNV86_15105, partial [Candidatus Acidoferrum sp.]|nr:hypothetical protein [Candidatus Acidoferrum sp.]
MIGGLLRYLLRFPHQRGKGPEITREIMATFSAGFACGVRLRASVQSLPWHQRSFFCEGHAMGQAARLAFKGRALCPDEGDAFTAARFIGYGFWNGVASRYRLPAVTVDAARSSPWQKSSRIGNAGETACATIANQQSAAQVGQAFSLPGLLPRAASPLLVDGASYGRILSRRRFDAGELARIRAIANEEDREAALHGAGRVLWLLYMYNYPALRVQLEACGPDREPVERGVGFAIGFIRARDAREIPAMLAEFGPAAARGAGIALALHTVQDAESCRAVTAQLQG